MKQTIDDYIRHDEKFRQALLEQEGGIMKFWAQHPESDFDITLFENYEKQIVGDYLQENKRNRSVHSLPPDEQKRKALAWYHLEERELHHQLALQPILAKLPDEAREHANRYFEDYLTDSYRQFIQYTYRDDISLAEFYRMVIGKFSVGGLARDCLDFVLKEHHHPEVWMRTKGEYSKLGEFYVQRYCSEVICQRGIYRKLREGVKEKLNGKSDMECRREAIKMMKMVKGFSRMIYSSAETYISDCTGKYVVDKDFLRKLVNGDTALRLWSHSEVPPLHECFFHYVITLEDIGRIWAAQLLVHGIDMHELEKETGAILYLVSKPTQDPDGLDHDNYKYYVDKDFNDPLDDQSCIYDEMQAKELLSKVRNKKGNNPPEVLLSDEAQPYWTKLREKGYIVATGYALVDGVNPYDATHIADLFSEKLKIKNKWKVFEALWGLVHMAQKLGDTRKGTGTVPHQKEIDEIFGVKPKKLEKL